MSFKPLIINTRAIRRLVPVTITLSVLMLLLTALVHKLHNGNIIQNEALQYIIGQFNLSSENNVASWYSSMLLLLTAMLAWICYWSSPSIEFTSLRGVFRHGWVFMIFVFVAMSLDEMGSVHENLGNLKFLDVMGDGSWQSVIAIPLILIMLYMMLFAWNHLRKNFKTMGWLTLGCLLFLSVPVQEHFEMKMWAVSNYAADWQRPIQFVLLEEGAELFASICFLAAMVSFLVDQKTEFVTLNINPESMRRTVLFVTFLLLVLCSLFFSFGLNENADEGIAINWFPSAVHFVIMVIFVMQRRGGLWSIAFLTFTSIYFATNLYAILDWSAIFYLRIAVSVLMIAGGVNTGMTFWKQGSTMVNLALYCWIISVCATLFIPSPLFTMIVLLSSLLFINADLQLPRQPVHNLRS